jgi:ribonuclease-3
MFEAIIAAVFFDGGYVAARAFVERVFADDLRLATPRSALDFKTLLQETLQSAKLPAPTYSVVRTEGPPHARTFHVEARWTGGSAGASGNSIKQAEMLAASAALDLLGSKVAADERQKS